MSFLFKKSVFPSLCSFIGCFHPIIKLFVHSSVIISLIYEGYEIWIMNIFLWIFQHQSPHSKWQIGKLYKYIVKFRWFRWYFVFAVGCLPKRRIMKKKSNITQIPFLLQSLKKKKSIRCYNNNLIGCEDRCKSNKVEIENLTPSKYLIVNSLFVILIQDVCTHFIMFEIRRGRPFKTRLWSCVAAPTMSIFIHWSGKTLNTQFRIILKLKCYNVINYFLVADVYLIPFSKWSSSLSSGGWGRTDE